MSYISKPAVRHPSLRKNALGLTRRDYEGRMSTLCAGCGHDSITSAIIQAFFELDIPPHRAAKMSGIGCSSKTPAYFLGESHGFNAVHGRMPAVASGANAANGELVYLGVSGDGDSLSIGLGQLCHAVRRNVNLLYIIENNGVYGLTKGQFSASADVGTKSKRGVENLQRPIDPVLLALSIGASFVARSFSGDKDQLVPIIKAGLTHKGFAIVDVISPCVTFNDHESSTKSYMHTRERYHEVAGADFVPPAKEITVEIEPGASEGIRMHDGSLVRFHKVEENYDPTDREAVYEYVSQLQNAGEVVTGLLYIEESTDDMHSILGTVDEPLAHVPIDRLVPGSQALGDLMQRFR
jgi:2-oxoglutarate ferredoxin oxidoreductase subunit beta